MKQVFSGEVYEMLPLSQGIIFSYNKATVDNRVVVFYKMLSLDTGRITDITNHVYLLTKFGNNYKAVSSLCDNFITAKSIVLTGGKVFMIETDGTAKLLDADASPIWTGELKYRNDTPSDIGIYKNALWACYAKSNVMLRFNLATMREELRIGGRLSPFNRPQDMFIDGENAMISNSGSNKLTRLNLDSYSVFDYETFDEPVYQYVCVNDYQFVILKSGLYLI